ncbi:MAG: menaquinone biosynthesis decarboxylase [Bacteroidetes bacterium]|nr:menaquinone biosynthesis decarboxylase [Bacteroidota bacterium]
MPYKGLNDFVEVLERENELIRISQKVDTVLEITEIVDRVSKSPGGGKALLFENNGTAFPLLVNAFGSESRICLALGHESLDKIGEEIEGLFKQLAGPSKNLLAKLKFLPLLSRIASWMPKKKPGRGCCQEIVMERPDLTQLPVLTCWPADGGPFITLPCVVTRDPETGARNVGMYRMQVFGPDLTGMHWHKHKTGARHYLGYQKQGKKMPVSVVLGGDPVYTYAATAPLPDQIDEYMLAGFLRKKKVELVKCLTNDLEVPDDADFVIEGFVDPAEDLVWEGPFGDHTGFYSLADWYPKFHVTCITHRKGAIYPATIVGIPPQEDTYIGLATEKIFLVPMKLTLIPELKDLYLPPEGVAHNLTLARIEKNYAGQALKTMNALWGAGQMMFNKIMVVTDEANQWKDIEEFVRKISDRINTTTDIIFSSGPMDVLDHSSSKFAFGSKMGIDATAKFPEELEGTAVETLLPNAEEFLKLPTEFPVIKTVNANLLNRGISVLILGVEKEPGFHLTELTNLLLKIEALQKVKFIVFVDSKLAIDNLNAVVWYVTGNIDPKRDCQIFKATGQNEVNHLVVDGTRKTLHADDFSRDWPNPVVSSLETIQRIDHLWPDLGLGEMVPSPSLTYYPLKRGEGAVSE